MEISSSLLPRALIGSGGGGRPRFRVRVPARAAAAAACGGSSIGIFSDEAHLKYYGEKEEKKRAKLIKGLKKDLSQLSSMAFGDQSDKISEMAEQLLEQLNQLKIEEKEMKKEMKKKKKEEKKAAMKEKCGDSSSSSSESSESDCEETKILQLSDLKLPQNNSNQIAISSDIRKIEVCMGGKCKKNGSVELLNKIEEKIGVENTVVGCKCMGRCKEGPNVRISNYGSLEREEELGFLCVGVGLDDVDSIVDKFDVGLESRVMIV